MSNGVITFTVAPNGNVHIDVEGVEGCGCAEATAAVEVLLGGKQKKELKDDYFREVGVEMQVTQ